MFFKWFWKLLLDERGQVPDSGTGEEPEGNDAGLPDGGSQEIGPEGGDEPTEGGEPTSVGQQAQQQQANDFLAESARRGDIMKRIQANPELKAAYSWMQSAYDKKLGGTKELAQKAALVERFQSDPTFALQTAQEVAARSGYQLVPINGTAQGVRTGYMPQQNGQVPAEAVEMIKGNLPQELQWLGEPLAKSFAPLIQQAVQAAIRPYQEQTQQQTAKQRETQYSEMAGKLAAVAPGWEEHEDEMDGLLDFLQSDQLTHPKYGSKLQILFDAVTRGATANQVAAQRFAQAAKNRTGSGQTVRTVSNLQQRIAQAKTLEDKWDIAAREAKAELERSGRRVS